MLNQSSAAGVKKKVDFQFGVKVINSLKPQYSFGIIGEVFINLLKSAAFSLQTAGNKIKHT